MLIVLAAVLCGLVWGMVHGQIWLQLNVPWMARTAQSLQGVRKRPNRRTEASQPPSFTASQKFLAALLGTVVTGGILVLFASGWLVGVVYLIGLFVGFSPALIMAHWPPFAVVGLILLVGIVGFLSYDGTSDPGDVDEHLRADEPGGPESSDSDDRPNEVLSESSPAPSPPEKTDTNAEGIVLRGIPFAFNDETIRPEFLTELNEAVQTLRDNPNISILIEGYSDAVGSESFNLRLSQERAEAVREHLVEHGIAAERLQAVGRGEANPLAPNAKDDGSDNPEGRAMNRRVEFSVE